VGVTLLGGQLDISLFALSGPYGSWAPLSAPQHVKSGGFSILFGCIDLCHWMVHDIDSKKSMVLFGKQLLAVSYLLFELAVNC